MAGQIPLETRYYPSDFHVTNVNIETSATGTNWPLIHADRTMVIDSINIYVSDAPTSSETIKIIKNSDFATPTYAGTGNSTVVVGEMTLGTTAGDYPVRLMTAKATQASPKITNISFVSGTNVLDEGHTLWLASNSALAGIVNISIQIRWRSQF